MFNCKPLRIILDQSSVRSKYMLFQHLRQLFKSLGERRQVFATSGLSTLSIKKPGLLAIVAPLSALAKSSAWDRKILSEVGRG